MDRTLPGGSSLLPNSLPEESFFFFFSLFSPPPPHSHFPSSPGYSLHNVQAIPVSLLDPIPKAHRALFEAGSGLSASKVDSLRESHIPSAVILGPGLGHDSFFFPFSHSVPCVHVRNTTYVWNQTEGRWRWKGGFWSRNFAGALHSFVCPLASGLCLVPSHTFFVSFLSCPVPMRGL